MAGILLAIDGADGGGKTTLVNAVGRALEASSVPYQIYRFPTHHGAVGKLIRKVFSGEEKVHIGAMVHLMTADAIDSEAAVRSDLEAGKVVLMDRHTVSSSWAYQTETHALDDVMRVVGPQKFQKPDITFILDVPTDVTLARMQARGGRDGYYENVDKAEMDRRRNKYIAFNLMNPFSSMLLDGSQPTEVNATVILKIIEAAKVPTGRN